MDEILARHPSEADEKITQLVAARLVTEKKLQRLIDERHGRKANPKAEPARL